MRIPDKALSFLYRLATLRPMDRLTLRALVDGSNRYGKLLPREIFDGLNTFFCRDLIGNVDSDSDGVADSFRLAITNAWFDQRICGVRMSIDGREVPGERLLVSTPAARVPAGEMSPLDFPPGAVTEIVAEGFRLADGLHLITLTVEMELVSQIIPLLPVLVEGGRGDFPILDDCFHPFGEWPPGHLEPGCVHVVPHVHYDVEWLCTRDVFEEVGAGNLREMLSLMGADEEMTFVLDQVPQLEPFRRRDPEGFEMIAGLVREGRIEPVCGMYSEPDVNILSGESLVRQTVAWQDYCLENFGCLSRCGWLIDSFGMSPQLPQIMRKSGVEFFCFSRARAPMTLPSEFLWEGLDGTRILTHNMPFMYNVAYPVPTDRPRAMRKMLTDYLRLRELSATEQVLYPGGADHGRPQAAFGEMIRAWNREVGEVSFAFSLPSRFFESLDGKDLPVHRGEFQRELWGTYSARSSVKRLNRACEFALTDAEKLATVAALHGAAYPQEEIETAWRTLMDNQFHDQICGCATDDVTRGMLGRFDEVISCTGGMMSDAAGYLSGSRDTGASILAFNPHASPTESWVEFEFSPPPGYSGLQVQYDGERMPVQIVDSAVYGDGTLKRVRAGFCPRLPALGYRRFDLLPDGEEVPAPQDPARADGLRISNGLIAVEVDRATGMLRCAELTDGLLFDLGGGNRLTLERDFGNLYEARAFGTTFLHGRRVSGVRVTERGPLRASIEVTGSVGKTDFTQRISVSCASPRIDMETGVYFRDAGCRLRCRFPTGGRAARWVQEVPYGWMERPGHVLPAQNFADASWGGAGITFINYGTPAMKFERGVACMTLLRSTDKIFLWDAGPLALELGRHDFRYSLYPHRGDFKGAESTRQAYLHNDPPRAFVITGPGGDVDAPSEYSALSVIEGDARVEVLGRREEGFLVRLWETDNRPQDVVLRTGWDAPEAFSTDLLGRPAAKIDFSGRRASFRLEPFEIATLLIRD